MNTQLSMRTLLLAAATFAASSSALAEELVAPSDEYPTIQSALRAAEDGDIVTVLPGVHVERLALTGSDGFRSFTLRGMGDPGQTVIRSADFRHDVSGWLDHEGGRENIQYTIENLTFASSADGDRFKDGLDIDHCTVTFTNCVFDRLVNDMNRDPNQPAGSDKRGAIDAHQCNLSLVNCSFTNNGVFYTRGSDLSQANGGAIRAYDSDIEITGCNFTGNHVRTTDSDRAGTNNTAARGGAIYARKGMLHVVDSTFSSNTAMGLGNMSQPDKIQGGAIYAESLDAFRIENTSFRHNRAERGVNDKWSTGKGGAIYILNSKPSTASYLINNEFVENHAGLTGGAVHADGTTQAKAKDDLYHCNTVNQVSGSWVDRGRNVFSECKPTCPLDVNGDGEVDKADMVEVYMHFGPAKDGSRYDLNDDGVVDYKDLVLVIANFNGCDK